MSIIIMVSSLIYSLCAVSGLLATTVNGLPKKGHRAETSLPIVKQTKCGSHTYQYNGLVGYGTVPSNAVDKYGDTLGGFGSSIAIEQASWKKNSDGTYEGIAWAIPDRGWYGRQQSTTERIRAWLSANERLQEHAGHAERAEPYPEAQPEADSGSGCHRLQPIRPQS